MKEIVNRLHENRQLELAKSILESNGYKVESSLRESDEGNKPKYFSKYSEEEIDALPAEFLCIDHRELMFDIVSKSALKRDPDRAFFVHKDWGYAPANSFRLATQEDLNKYEKRAAGEIKSLIAKYRAACIK